MKFKNILPFAGVALFVIVLAITATVVQHRNAIKKQPVTEKKAQLDSLETKIKSALLDYQKLAEQFTQTRQQLLQDSIYILNFDVIYTVTFQVKQFEDNCPDSKPIQFVLPVSRSFYNTIEPGTTLSSGIDIGDGFKLSGKLEGWSVVVMDKQLYTKKPTK